MSIMCVHVYTFQSLIGYSLKFVIININYRYYKIPDVFFLHPQIPFVCHKILPCTSFWIKQT